MNLLEDILFLRFLSQKGDLTGFFHCIKHFVRHTNKKEVRYQRDKYPRC